VIALKIPLGAFAFVGRGQRGDTADAGIETLGDALDGTALAGGIATLEDHDDLQPLMLDPVLKADQFMLKPEKLTEIDAALDLLAIGIVGQFRQHRFEAALVDLHLQLLVKAVGGGGGKGMRLVDHPSQLSEAISAASREARNAFGDERVFIEKYLRSPRHIEFQILGDAHGEIIHVFERECSIQRRYQKIIEETPSPALAPQLRARMGEAAVAAARAADYVNAGTVEFVLNPDGHFYFLEMNTRLQVEHAITEMTTGLDLVREQILIAGGLHLSRTQSELQQTGHSIECRIYAEVPEENFRPDTGVVAVYRPPSGPGIRLDSGIQEGSEVGFHYDPMLAKLIVWASSRDAAIERMKRALSDFVVLGVRNNIEFLHRVISSEEYRTGKFDTQFLDRQPDLLNASTNDIPPAARIVASLDRLKTTSGSGQMFTDVWTSGAWRNS